MTAYHLTIVTPDGSRYDGEAEQLLVRTTTGDLSILAGHIEYVAALGMGVARVTIAGEVRRAACIGGLLTVHKGEVRLVASTFEWSEDIDLDRAKRAETRAREQLASDLSESDRTIYEAALKRSLVRQSAAE